MSTWTLKISQFEGPLDMLLYMVNRAKLDIRDIFISEITEQFIQSVRESENTVSMDEASEFIRMAATLLEIKSRAMLPREEEPEEESPEEILMRQLEEYAAFKEIAQDLQRQEQDALKHYTKLPEEYPLPPPTLDITGLTLEGLLAAFARVMAREKAAGADTTREAAHRIYRDGHTIPDCMRRIMRTLRRGEISFQQLVSKDMQREEVITLFLALLELLRLGRAQVVQDGIFGDIQLRARSQEEKDLADQ